jgi:hypothetical protein
MIPFARVTISYPIDAVFKEVADEDFSGIGMDAIHETSLSNGNQIGPCLGVGMMHSESTEEWTAGKRPAGRWADVSEEIQIFGLPLNTPAGAFARKINDVNDSSVIRVVFKPIK